MIITRCPKCSTLFGVCDEIDHFIADIRNLTVSGAAYGLDCPKCPSCEGVSVENFAHAEFDEIAAEGFAQSEIFRMPDPFPECPVPMSRTPRTYAEYQRAQQAATPPRVGD